MRKILFLFTFCAGLFTARAQTFTSGLTTTGTGAAANTRLGGTSALLANTNLELGTFNFNLNNGKVGIGVAAPLSLLHIKAGTATVAPLIFTTGVNLTTPVAGALEFDATGLNFTPIAGAGNRKVLAYTDLSNLSGVIPIAKGGTGVNALATGYVKSNGTVLSTVATVAGADVNGNISGNAANVTGLVAVANGGTGATTNTGVLFGNGTAATTSLPATAGLQYLRRNAANTAYEFATITGGTGTVTGVSVATANGFGGTVATSTTTPAITITTNQTGLLKGNGTAILPAVAGTDYLAPNGSAGALTSFPTLNQNTTGTAANVTGIVGIANGGTGATTAATALTAILPTQTGNANKVLRTDGTTATWQTIAGTGTVTNTSVVTANGISGTVATSTTTPAITLALGAITPTSVAATGAVTASNLSGTNTGDNAANTLYSGLVTNATHTGDVSGATTLTVNGIKNVTIPALATGNLRYNGTAWVFDNSALTSFTETDPLVKAINGLVKSNGTTIAAAVAGTDYLTPTGSAARLTSFPTLNQNTTGTAASITGAITESQVTNLVSDLAAKQTNLISGTNIKTINGTPVLGSGDLIIASAPETDPIVKAINGLVKSNGTTISPAVAGTDYLTPNGSAAGLTAFPTLNQNTTGTAATITGAITESQVTNLVADLAAKQASLVSGTNIKTVNGTSILGTGNVVVTATETDPIVKAITGLIKSNGTTISAATAGTDYLTPTGSAAGLTSFPTLNQNTTGNAASATAASNIAGGLAGSIPYQTASGVTGMLAAGTTNNVLTMGATGTPTWAAPATQTNYWTASGNDVSNNNTGNVVINTNITSPGTGIGSEHFGNGSSTGTAQNATAIGNTAIANASGSLAIGKSITSAFNNSIGIGTNAIPSAINSVALGNSVSGVGAIGMGLNLTGGLINIGSNNNSGVNNTNILIGSGLVPIGQRELRIGSGNAGWWPTDIYLSGATANALASTYGNQTFHAISGLGTNIAGQGMTFKAGKSTGNADGGVISFFTTAPGAAGATENTELERMRISARGNVGMGTAAPDTTLHVVGKFKYQDGSQAVGKVLTSDVNGLASWAAAPSAITTAWGLQGNSGTNPATNFIGTTDNQDLVFKTNNTIGATLSSGNTYGKTFTISGATNSNAFLSTESPNATLSLGQYGSYTTLSADGRLTLGADRIFRLKGNTASLDNIVFSRCAACGPGNIISARVDENGTDLFTVNSNGNTGIGIATPTAKLDIAGNIKITDGTQGLNKVLTSDANGLASWQSIPPSTGGSLPNSQIGFGNGSAIVGNSNLTWDNSNKLLKVGGKVGIDSSIVVGSSYGYGTNYGDVNNGIFQIKDGGGYKTQLWLRPAGNSENFNGFYWSRLENSGYVTSLFGGTYHDLNFGHGVTVAATLKNNGNLLVGTTTDAGYKLDINGVTNTQGFRMPIGAGINKVLTSDANGLASWQPITTGSTTDTSLLVHKAGDETINDNKTFVNAVTVNTLKIGKGGTIPTGNLYGLVMGENSLSATTGLNTNMAIGSSIMNNHTTGNYNIGIGGIALREDSSGIGNTAVGVASMRANITGKYTTASGYSSGSYDKYGSYNTAIGATSGGSIAWAGMTYIPGDTIRYSTFLGYSTGGKKRRGYANLMIGGGAGYNATFGDSSTYIGTEAGYNSTGSNNVFIGNRAGFNENSSNKLYIANGRTKALIGGDFSTNQVQINGAAIPIYTPSAAFEVKSPDNNQGAIPYPIMTNAQRLAIPSPAVGLHIYQNDGTEGIWIYKSTGWAFVGGGGSTGWGLTGNAGTTPGTNFIGTTDNNPLVFKVSNVESGRLDSINNNTSYGFRSGGGMNAGTENTLIGSNAGNGNTADLITVIGSHAARNNDGFNLTAIGAQAADNNVGNGVTAIGVAAAFNNTGHEVTAIGNSAALANTKNNITAIGAHATVTVDNAISLGGISGVNGATANVNVGIGTNAPTAQLHTTNTVRFEKFKNNNAMDSVLTTDTSGNLKLKYFAGGAGGVDNSKWTLVGNNIYSRDSANVGIGVNNATAKLHAKGTIRFESLKNNAAKDSVLTTDSSGNLSMKYLSADNSKWRLNGNNIYSRDSAYVGIGTDSATDKFHVFGSMRFQSFKNNAQGDSVLTTDTSGRLKMVYLPYGSGGGGGGATYTFKNGVTQSNGIVNIGGALEDTVNLNLAGYAFNINNGTQKLLTASSTNNNIGVGTAPVADYRMSVNGDATIGNATSTTGIGNKLWFNGTGNGDNIWMSRFNTAASNTDLRMNIGNGAGISNDRLDVGYDSANNWNSKFVVQNNGMVGIGTSQLNGLLSLGSSHGSKIAIGNNAWAKTSVISTGNNANADGDFTDLLVAGQNNNNAVLRINSKGNVGIGTSTNTALDSSYRLSVNGKIRAKGLRVQTTGWADFVFEPGYKLKSLIEVEAFINKNKHLPEMLPATKVIAEGNDVGETQVKLLQKVEELTLYLIDQDKQLKKLQEQNKALDTQNKEIENLKKQMDEMKALLQKAK